MESLYGELGIIAMRGCEQFVSVVDEYLKEWRRHDDDTDFIMHVDCPRFSSGEAKALLKESARGHDIYIILTALTTVSSTRCTAGWFL